MAGEDYVAQQGTIVLFEPGVSRVCLTVQLMDDCILEDIHVFNVILLEPPDIHSGIKVDGGDAMVFINEAEGILQEKTVMPC